MQVDSFAMTWVVVRSNLHGSERCGLRGRNAMVSVRTAIRIPRIDCNCAAPDRYDLERRNGYFAISEPAEISVRSGSADSMRSVHRTGRIVYNTARLDRIGTR